MIWTAFALLGMFFFSCPCCCQYCNREMTGNICSSLFDNLSSPPLPLSRLLCTEENCASLYLYLHLFYLYLYLCYLYLFNNLSSPPLPLSRLLYTEENCASYYLYLYLCYLHLYLCDLYLYLYLFDNLSLPRLPLSRLLCKGGGGELCIIIFVLFAFNRIFWPLS